MEKTNSQRDSSATEGDKVDIYHDLQGLHDEFAGAFAKCEPAWTANFKSLQNGIYFGAALSESKTGHRLISRVYSRFSSDEEVKHLEFADRSELTLFGLLLTQYRLGLGYLGNVCKAEVLEKEQCELAIFAYEAFWRFHDDYFVDYISDDFLLKLSVPKSWPDTPNVGGGPGAIDRYRLGIEIVEAVFRVRQRQKMNKASLQEEGKSSFPKTELVDFRSKLAAMKPSLGQRSDG